MKKKLGVTELGCDVNAIELFLVAILNCFCFWIPRPNSQLVLTVDMMPERYMQYWSSRQTFGRLISPFKRAFNFQQTVWSHFKEIF